MDASGYEMFSSASGIIRSETQANMVVPRSEAGDPFQMLLRQRIVMLGNPSGRLHRGRDYFSVAFAEPTRPDEANQIVY